MKLLTSGWYFSVRILYVSIVSLRILRYARVGIFILRRHSSYERNDNQGIDFVARRCTFSNMSIFFLQIGIPKLVCIFDIRSDL